MTTRREQRALWLARGIGLFCLVLTLTALVLLTLDWTAIDSPVTAQMPYFIGAPIAGILGVLIAARRPRNPIGWLLLGIAIADSMLLFSGFVAVRGILAGASPAGWVAWAAWVFSITAGLGGILLLFLVLFFPNGRLMPGPRWRWAGRVVFVAAIIVVGSVMFAVPPIQLSPRLPSVPNPLGVRALAGLTDTNGALTALSFLLMFGILGVVAAVRFRRSRGAERRQMRSFALVAGAALVLLLSSFLSPSNATWGNGVAYVALGVGFGVLVPATIGLAVMRHGLYDIDVFISRTLVYGSLAVFITAVYVGIAVGIGTLVGSGGKPNLGLSILATGIVAVGFQPVRERVQRVANRLVYGTRATPYEVLSQFSERVAESYASEDAAAHGPRPRRGHQRRSRRGLAAS